MTTLSYRRSATGPAAGQGGPPPGSSARSPASATTLSAASPAIASPTPGMVAASSRWPQDRLSLPFPPATQPVTAQKPPPMTDSEETMAGA
jgi:hypothetical protein